MLKDQTPLFIPIGNFSDHCNSLDGRKLLPLINLIQEMELRFYKAERYYQDPSLLRGLDTVTLGKIMTVLLRSQTIYGPTFLESKIKDKFVLFLLKAIVHSLDQTNISGYLTSDIVD